jgi:hypothetical protein
MHFIDLYQLPATRKEVLCKKLQAPGHSPRLHTSDGSKANDRGHKYIKTDTSSACRTTISQITNAGQGGIKLDSWETGGLCLLVYCAGE